MPKNIAIFLDGTWNDKDDPNVRTNVAMLHEMCVNDAALQLTYYDNGVGTRGGYDAKLGGVHGFGLSDNVRQAYTFLAQHFQPGDRLYVFGFSRGAYTARSLAGLIYQCGLLPAHSLGGLPGLYDAYKDRDNAKMQALKSSNSVCPVTMIGVWDTVGALGIPVSFMRDQNERLFGFHDTKLNPEIGFACHAVAIDEKRAAFEPTLWDESGADPNRVRQVWFAGVHSDVGGGYPERHHSDVPLQWMRDHAVEHGLRVREDVNYQPQTDLAADIHESNYRVLGIDIGVEEREAPVSGPAVPTVHRSVLEKLRARPDYVPLALRKHLQDRDSLRPYVVEERPEPAALATP